MAKPILPVEKLRQLVHYCPDTGVFTRLVTTSPNAKKGDRCGNEPIQNGYCLIRIAGTQYKAHRVAWAYMTGEWPSGVIDHINGIKHDNRFTNLRDTSKSINRQNQRTVRSDNLSSGVTGVSWCRHHNKWKAYIRVDGKLRHLKYCDSVDDAERVYLKAKESLHPGALVSDLA